MEKLNKVIAGLSGCVAGNCSNCEYGGSDCGRDFLMEDALEVILTLEKKYAAAIEMAAVAEEQVAEAKRAAAGAEPVVHAHWVVTEGHYGRICSNCGVGIPKLVSDAVKSWLRCPVCGAHMDETLEQRTGYCPLCDKEVFVVSGSCIGHCPDCGHHLTLYGKEERA